MRQIRFTAILLILGVAANGRAAVYGNGHSVSVSTQGEDFIEDCGQIQVRYGDRDAARAETDVNAPLPRDLLTLRMPAASGLFVRGGTQSGAAIHVCKAALNPADLSRIEVSVGSDGQASVNGPSNDDWLVYLMVEVPQVASVDLQGSNGPISVRGLTGAVKATTVNGPLSLRDLSGHATARAQNGPISIRECTGALDAEATNGPISLQGGGGQAKLVTENGPISVELAGTRWEGTGLEAHAANGPLSVKIPGNYQSGTRIESSGRSPFTCRAAACARGRQSWGDDSKTIQIGEPRTVVRLSTINGPVSVQDADE